MRSLVLTQCTDRKAIGEIGHGFKWEEEWRDREREALQMPVKVTQIDVITLERAETNGKQHTLRGKVRTAEPEKVVQGSGT